MTEIGDPCRSEVRLGTAAPEAQCYITGFFRKRDTSGAVIDSQVINIAIGSREFTIGEQERWIICDSLIQQSNYFAHILGDAGCRYRPQLLRPQVAIVCNKICCRWLFYGG